MQKPTLLCSAKTHTTTSGKLGRVVGCSTRASRAGVGFYTTLQVYCNWFVSDFTLLSVSIYLFYPSYNHTPGPNLQKYRYTEIPLIQSYDTRTQNTEIKICTSNIPHSMILFLTFLIFTPMSLVCPEL